MTMKPSDFATYKEALAYANTRLDEWKEKFRELEQDMVFLSKNPYIGAVDQLAIKWQDRAADIQGAKT